MSVRLFGRRFHGMGAIFINRLPDIPRVSASTLYANTQPVHSGHLQEGGVADMLSSGLRFPARGATRLTSLAISKGREPRGDGRSESRGDNERFDRITLP